MSLRLRRNVLSGRTWYSAITASYKVRIDGQGKTWYATIRHRSNDQLAQFLDRDADKRPLTSRDDTAAAAEAWIRNHNNSAAA